MTQRHHLPCVHGVTSQLTNLNYDVTVRSMINTVIGYVRVSTQKQGKSGLGMEAQRQAVESYALENGAHVASLYVEVESGKRADRPELAKAISHAKHNGAKLVIAKLDRLARSVAFTSAVMDAGVEFVCCDNPHANRLTLHILAVMAEHEAIQASTRTKAALAAAKARGVKLGSDRPGHWGNPKRVKARLAGIRRAANIAGKLRTERARTAYAHVEPILAKLRGEGLSLRGMAGRLNERGLTTKKGKAWGPVQIGRVITRMEERVSATGDQPERPMSKGQQLFGVRKPALRGPAIDID
jgi:DNA invertase Pin-like site-specific DNA recombinase